MPKRIGNLLPVMTDRNFIRGEMFQHAKKRMDDPTTVPALLHADECVAQVQHWIICGDWVPSKPIHTQHYEPSNGKLRDIDYVPFWPDGVMHWILIDSIYDKVVPKLDPTAWQVSGDVGHTAPKSMWSTGSKRTARAQNMARSWISTTTFRKRTMIL